MGFVSLISCYFTLLYYRTVRRHWPEQQDARTVRLHELLTDRDVGVQPLPGNAAVKPRVRTVYLHVLRKDRHSFVKSRSGTSVDTASQPLSTTCKQPTESYRPMPPPKHPLMFLKAVPKKVDQSRFPKAEESPAFSETHLECSTQGADLAELEPQTLEERKYTDQKQDDTEHVSNNVDTEEMVPSVEMSGKYHDIENVLEVDSKLETTPGILEDEISSSSVGAFFTPVYRIFIYIAMLVTMVMAFLLHKRIYDNFLELNLDEQHVADVLCIASVYSLLQFCSFGITYCSGMTITNFERHQHQRQYDHSLHAKQVVLIVVGIFSPIFFVLGKAVIARYLTPADCVTDPKIADYLRILLVEMVYPCWLDQLNSGTGPRSTEVTLDSCIKMTVHVVITTIMAFSVVTINWLMKRFRRMQLYVKH